MRTHEPVEGIRVRAHPLLCALWPGFKLAKKGADGADTYGTSCPRCGTVTDLGVHFGRLRLSLWAKSMNGPGLNATRTEANCVASLARVASHTPVAILETFAAAMAQITNAAAAWDRRIELQGGAVFNMLDCDATDRMCNDFECLIQTEQRSNTGE